MSSFAVIPFDSPGGFAGFNPCPILTFSDCCDEATLRDDLCNDETFRDYFCDAATVADKKSANGADAAASGAKTLLGLYHEIAAGVPDAVFMLTCITPAKTKGASGTVSP